MTSTPAREDGASAEEIVGRFPLRLIDAWNRGCADDFAALFADDADFIAFEGTHLKGRHQIAEFHRRLFGAGVVGRRLAGDVNFLRMLGEVAVMFSTARVILPGHARATKSRNSMQLIVATKSEEWRIATMIDARQPTLDQQYSADVFESLPLSERKQVMEMATSLYVQQVGHPGVGSC